jgi:hypothetical protein
MGGERELSRLRKENRVLAWTKTIRSLLCVDLKSV